MKDDAERVASARADAADAMTHYGAVDAADALHGAVTHGKNHALALAQWHDFGA